MMHESNEYSLQEKKDILQEIIDKHLPKDKQFSIQDLDEKGVDTVIHILLEKDDKNREEIRQQLEAEYKIASEHLKQIYQKILEIHDQVNITEQLGNSLEELKANIKNDESLSQLEKEIGF